MEKYKLDKCDKCDPPLEQGHFCRCEDRNIQVAKMLREQGKSPWSHVPEKKKAEGQMNAL